MKNFSNEGELAMNKKLIWFVLAVLIQCSILTAVPAKKIYTRLTGKTIILKTAPVDPYDFLSGYHVILRYEISRPEGLGKIKNNTIAYVVLKEGKDGIWSDESIHNSRPKEIPAGCIVIKGKKERRGILYGVENYFIPERSRSVIENDLRKNAGKAKAQIKVDKFGNAALIKLLVEDRVY